MVKASSDLPSYNEWVLVDAFCLRLILRDGSRSLTSTMNSWIVTFLPFSSTETGEEYTISMVVAREAMLKDNSLCFLVEYTARARTLAVTLLPSL